MAENESNNKIISERIKTNSQIKIVNNTKKIIIILLLIILVLIILAVSDYHNKKKNATEDPNDPKNGPAAANEFINNIYIDENGVLRTEKSVRELWNELKQKGNTLTKYLNSSEELAKLFSASIATDFPDTRGYQDTSKSPDDPIDWSKYDIGIDSTEVQGIVKFKRALSSNKTITMTYTSPSEFQKKMDKYNKTGKTEDRDEALKYFTIEKTYDPSNTSGLANVGSRAYNDNVLNVENIVDVVNTTGDLGHGKRYEAVQSGCFDGKYLICAMNKWGERRRQNHLD